MKFIAVLPYVKTGAYNKKAFAVFTSDTTTALRSPYIVFMFRHGLIKINHFREEQSSQMWPTSVHCQSLRSSSGSTGNRKGAEGGQRGVGWGDREKRGRELYGQKERCIVQESPTIKNRNKQKHLHVDGIIHRPLKEQSYCWNWSNSPCKWTRTSPARPHDDLTNTITRLNSAK